MKETRQIVLMSINGGAPQAHVVIDWMLDSERAAPDWVQISEPVTVEFPLLDKGKTNQARYDALQHCIDAIEAKIDAIEARAKSAVDGLHRQQQELLAIEHQPETEK